MRVQCDPCNTQGKYSQARTYNFICSSILIIIVPLSLTSNVLIHKTQYFKYALNTIKVQFL